MIDFYTAPTPNGHKVSCTLEAMELEYETHVVNLMENEESTAYITKVLDQAVTQNIGGIDKKVANDVLTELRNGNPQQAKELIFPPPLPTSD